MKYPRMNEDGMIEIEVKRFGVEEPDIIECNPHGSYNVCDTCKTDFQNGYEPKYVYVHPGRGHALCAGQGQDSCLNKRETNFGPRHGHIPIEVNSLINIIKAQQQFQDNGEIGEQKNIISIPL